MGLFKSALNEMQQVKTNLKRSGWIVDEMWIYVYVKAGGI